MMLLVNVYVNEKPSQTTWSNFMFVRVSNSRNSKQTVLSMDNPQLHKLWLPQRCPIRDQSIAQSKKG